MRDTRTGVDNPPEVAPPPAPNWAVAAWLGAKSALARFVAARGKDYDEARARDRVEGVFHPREH